jgi:hypothetical protein
MQGIGNSACFIQEWWDWMYRRPSQIQTTLKRYEYTLLDKRVQCHIPFKNFRWNCTSDQLKTGKLFKYFTVYSLRFWQIWLRRILSSGIWCRLVRWKITWFHAAILLGLSEHENWCDMILRNFGLLLTDTWHYMPEDGTLQTSTNLTYVFSFYRDSLLCYMSVTYDYYGHTYLLISILY